MMKDRFFEELKEKIQPYFEAGGSHSFDHTQRVFNNAVTISEGENVDLDIVKAAALLHDISRLKEDRNEVECHAEHGSETAGKILKEMNFPEDKIKNVVYAIKVHRHSKDVKPKTKEAAIIQDADRLDALGAICIARMFSTGGRLNRPLYNPNIPFDKIDLYNSALRDFSVSTIHSFHKKILKLKPETFKTKKAKEIAKDRYKFTEDFVERFKLEWDGKK